MKQALKSLITLGFLIPGIALSGIRDTPLTRFSDGSKARLVYSVPGVVANRGGLATSFLCTNLDRKPVSIGVEVFGYSGGLLNDFSLGEGAVVDIPPGHTRTFSTQNTAAYIEDRFILDGEIVDQGSARIVATTKRIACAAMQVSEAGSPPSSMVLLPVIKARTQRGM